MSHQLKQCTLIEQSTTLNTIMVSSNNSSNVYNGLSTVSEFKISPLELNVIIIIAILVFMYVLKTTGI